MQEIANVEVYTNASADTGRAALRRLEQVRHVFESRTGDRAQTPLQVRLFVFRSVRDFRPFQVQHHGAGYYQPEHDRDYLAVSASGGIERTLVHEYIHLLLRHDGRPVPVWLNEGIAEMYSTIQLSGSEVRFGHTIPAHLLTLRNNAMLDLPTLMAVKHDSPHYSEREKSEVFYAQSWALVHMLNFSSEYQPGIQRFIGMMSSAAVPEDALKQAFGKSEATVLADLKRYVRQQRFSELQTYRAVLEDSVDVKEITMGRAAAELALIDLLIAIRKEPEAEARLHRLEQACPKMPEVQVALGDLAMGRNDPALAKHHFELAFEFGSRSGRARLDYAMLLRDSGTSDTTISEQLARAVIEEPKLFEARYFFGSWEFRERRFDEAVRHLRIAVELQPSHGAAWENLALAYKELGDTKSARHASTQARRAARQPQDISRIEAMIHEIEASPRGSVQKTLEVRPKLTQIKGLLTQVDCLGESARLHIRSGGSKVFLLIRDPSSITVRGAPSVTTELSCGLHNQAIGIEYRPNTNKAYQTSGEVVSVDLR